MGRCSRYATAVARDCCGSMKTLYNSPAPSVVRQTAETPAPLTPYPSQQTLHFTFSFAYVGKIPTEEMDKSVIQARCLSDFSSNSL
jgi:hypothetical protein